MPSGRVAVPLVDRFWPKVQIAAPSECWLWIGSLNSTGYGNIGYQGRVIGAHRAAWFLHYGRWPEHSACHSCDTPRCVNWRHLFDGDHLVNMQDKMAKGRWKGSHIRGNARWSTKIPVELFPDILQRIAGGQSRRSIARDLKVCHETINKIASGKRQP